VGTTSADGKSTASNLYTAPQAGSYIQTAEVVRRSAKNGFQQANEVFPVGPKLTIKFTQQ
jgi:hypothetical protein